jgi:hypothetical protein
MLDSGPHLNIEYILRVSRTDSVLQFIKECQQFGYSASDVQNEIVNKSVVASYGNHRFYRVDQLCHDKTPVNHKFTNRQGKEVNLIQYYKEQYNTDIKDKNQPLLLHVRIDKH